MSEDAELTDDIQTLVDESSKQLRNCTTPELMEKLESITEGQVEVTDM